MIAAGLGVAPWTMIQLRYSYVHPRPGARLDDGHVHAGPEQLDHASAEGLEVWAYTPLINGSYVRADRPLPEAYDHPGTTRRLAVLAEVAKETGATANQVVLAWMLGGGVADRRGEHRRPARRVPGRPGCRARRRAAGPAGRRGVSGRR